MENDKQVINKTIQIMHKKLENFRTIQERENGRVANLRSQNRCHIYTALRTFRLKFTLFCGSSIPHQNVLGYQ